MFPADALIGRGCDLPGQSPQRIIVKPRILEPFDPMLSLQPQFTGPVDVHVSHVITPQRCRERRKECIEEKKWLAAHAITRLDQP
jgi:hypothetical protein